MRRIPLYVLLIVLLAAGPAALRAQDQEAQDPPPPAAAGATEETAEPDAAAEPEEDRVTFDIALGEAQGGGRAVGSAGDFEYQEDAYLIATDGVELDYQDLHLEARRVRIDLPTRLLTAEGEVVLDEGPQRLTGETLEWDLGTRTGKITQATAYVSPDYYFSGSQIAKIDDVVYKVDDGVFTACDQEVPSWSIHLSDARITLEEFARIRNARLKFKSVPVFYLPYLVWPATVDRASGFLMPKPGYSSRFGATLDLAYYKTLGRSADTTFFFDPSSEGFFGLGNETRYHPSEGTQGTFRAYFLSQPDDLPAEFIPVFEPGRPADEARWKVELLHDSRDLWGQFRGVVDIKQYSDLDYLQDFERQVGIQTRSYIYSKAYLTRNVGQHSINILADQRERILTRPQEDVRRQLPEFEYRLKPTQLGGTPLYLSIESALHYLAITQRNSQLDLDDSYGRVNFRPTLSIPVSTLSWLSAKLDLGGRVTYYTDSLKARFDDGGNPILGDDGNPIGTEFGGGSLSRVLPEAELEIVGPVFSRIFDKKLGRFAKLKHIVEPRTTYGFLDEFDEQAQIFRFDEIDNLTAVDGITFAFFNRLMGKPSDPDQGGAIEIASLELRQSRSLDDERPGQVSAVDPLVRSKAGPLIASLRINPSTKTSVKLDVRYNTLFDELQSLSLSGGTKLGRHSLGLTWFTNWQVEDLVRGGQVVPAGEKISEQLRLFGKLEIVPRRLSLDAQISYDPQAEENKIRHQRYFFNWKSQCYSWQIEFRESIRGTGLNVIEDRDVRFALTLKNVGTFLDLHETF
jgi:LPS-assembly protein